MSNQQSGKVKTFRRFCGGDEPKSFDPPRDDEIITAHRKKNRRIWCKGRVGIEHKPEWTEDLRYANYFSSSRNGYVSPTIHEIFRCIKCGKELHWRSRCRKCKQILKDWRPCVLCRKENGDWKVGDEIV